MAYTTINKSTDYFNTVLYTGNGGTQSITGVGFDPDWSWNKARSNTEVHELYDKVRGATKRIMSQSSDAENTESYQSFITDGFAWSGSGNCNQNAITYASWNWKAGTTSGVDFSSGDITPTAYSINTTSGIGIYRYNCTGANATMVHGLSSAPKMLITKSLGDTAPWAVWHTGMNPTNYLVLDTTAAEVTGTAMWNSTAPSSSVISLGSDGQSNGSGKNNIMYAFSEVAGYSRFSSYIGNGNADGTFVYTGFKPAFVICKKINNAEDWGMWGHYPAYNLIDRFLYGNSNTAESTGIAPGDFLSNGFKLRTTDGKFNGSGETYIYMAFGQSIVGTNGVPATAR